MTYKSNQPASSEVSCYIVYKTETCPITKVIDVMHAFKVISVNKTNETVVYDVSTARPLYKFRLKHRHWTKDDDNHFIAWGVLFNRSFIMDNS